MKKFTSSPLSPIPLLLLPALFCCFLQFCDATPTPPIKDLLDPKKTKTDGSQDYKIIGSDQFNDANLYKAGTAASGTASATPGTMVATPEQLETAYNDRLEEMDATKLKPADKDRLQKMIDEAYKRLEDLINVGDLITKIDADYKKYSMDERQRHLALLGLSPTLPDNLLLNVQRYNEARLAKLYNKKAEPLKAVPSVHADLAMEAETALKHLNGAYNDLRAYGIVNTIRSADANDYATMLGYKTMDQMQADDSKVLLKKFHERRDLVAMLRVREKAKVTTTSGDTPNLKMVEAALEKLNDAFLHALDGNSSAKAAKLVPSSTVENTNPSTTMGNSRKRKPDKMGWTMPNPPMMDHGMMMPTPPMMDQGMMTQNSPMMNQGMMHSAMQPMRAQPLSKPGDIATNCGEHVHQCFMDNFVQSMARLCRTTCGELGKDGMDVGTNCWELASQNLCNAPSHKFLMSKYCAGTCYGSYR